MPQYAILLGSYAEHEQHSDWHYLIGGIVVVYDMGNMWGCETIPTATANGFTKTSFGVPKTVKCLEFLPPNHPILDGIL